MTRRLGGIGGKSLAVLASLSLAATLACGFALTGCGGDSNPAQVDGGDGSSDSPVVDTKAPDVMGMDSTMMTDAGMDVARDNFVPDNNVADTNPPPVDSGPDSPGPCGAPTIMPNGGSIASGSNVTIVPPAGFPASGFIFYTVDGTLPTHTSPAYSGPIQVSQNETIRAIAFAAGTCGDSAYVQAMFTVMTTDAGAPPPVFNPTSTTQTNDFVVTLSAGAGDTICYALGTTPQCANGVCAAGSTTYMGTGISVNGTITNASTGVVTIQALACRAGIMNSAVAPQSYTLRAAPPVMVMPDNSVPLAYVSAGTSYTPTISSPTNGSFIRAFTGTNMPDCVTGTGMQLANPSLLGSGGSLPAITQNTLFQLVACKTGYAPSVVTPFQYLVALNKPTFQNPGGTYDTAPYVPLVGTVVSDTVNGGTGAAGHWLCWTSDNSTPVCNTAGGACTTGTMAATAAGITVTATGQQVNVVACSPSNGTANSGFQNSAVPDSSGVYTLQLDPVYFSPQPGANVGSYTFVTADGASISTTLIKNGSGNTAAHVCYGLNTGPVDCTCNTVTTGHGTLYTGAAFAVMPGQTWTAVACSADTTVITDSQPTNATYNAVGSATAPTITPAPNGNITTQQVITLTNPAAAPRDSTLCWTTDTTAPGCATAGSTTCSTTSIAVGASTPGPTIQNNPTTVKAIACNATQSPSPTPNQYTYTFQLASPTVTGTTAGDLTLGGMVSGGQVITIATASNFTGETINWSDNNSMVTCVTAQHTVAAGSFTYTVPSAAASVTLHIVACGTAQLASAEITVPLTVGTATPVITNNAPATGTGSLTWENTFTVTISTTTPGATICYRTGTTTVGTPTCTTGGATGACDVNSTAAAAPVTLPTINASGTNVAAVACTGTLASTGSATATYTLNITPVAATGAVVCPMIYSIGPAAGSTIGGPTTGATLCYSTSVSFSYCAPPPYTGVPAGVTCIPYAATALPAMVSSGSVNVTTCEAGFIGNTGSMIALPVTADSNAGITVDGVLSTGEWLGTNTLAGTGVTGYYAYNAGTLYFATSGYTPLAARDVVIYLGDGSGTGDTTGPGPLGSAGLGFPAKWAFAWATDNTSAVVAYAWTSGPGWATTTLTPGVTVGFTAGATVEFSLPLAALGALTTVDVSGGIVSNVGTAPDPTTGSWPSGGALHFVRDLLTSCQNPTGELQ